MSPSRYISEGGPLPFVAVLEGERVDETNLSRLASNSQEHAAPKPKAGMVDSNVWTFEDGDGDQGKSRTMERSY